MLRSANSTLGRTFVLIFIMGILVGALVPIPNWFLILLGVVVVSGGAWLLICLWAVWQWSKSYRE